MIAQLALLALLTLPLLAEASIENAKFWPGLNSNIF